jgi:SET domain-containing protein
MNPHDGVYTRLQPSPLHGVGVFAILDIPKGTYVFPLDDDPLVEVNRSTVEQQPKEIQRLYNDFCILKDDGDTYLCPVNLNRMTISWYLNESKMPNVKADNEYRFYTVMDVKAGEELTADYSEYSERPPTAEVP